MAWSNVSRHARGYGARWDKLRLLVLARDHYICHCPQCKGGESRLRPASEVDHIRPKSDGGTDAMANLRAVHPECHRRITLEANGHAPRQRIGLDGYPDPTDG